jgi:hypothetical protein
MSSEETYAKALRIMELAKSATNPSHRRMMMDNAFALIREAKCQRQNEPPKPAAEHPPKYRVWFRGLSGYLYFDLPMARRSDALWAAETLAAALSEDYDRYALWCGQTQLFNSPTSQAVFSCRTAVEVTQASQQIVLDAEELALANHQILAESRHLIATTARMRQILSEPPAMPEGRAARDEELFKDSSATR